MGAWEGTAEECMAAWAATVAIAQWEDTVAWEAMAWAACRTQTIPTA